MKEWVDKYNEERGKRRGKERDICELLLASLWGAYSVQVLDQWAGPALNFYEKGSRGITITEHKQENNRIKCKGTVKRYIKAWGLLVKATGLRRLLKEMPEKLHMPEIAVPERPLPTKLNVHKIETGLTADLSSKDRKEELLELLDEDVMLEEKGLRITDYELIDVYLTDLREDESEATLNVYLQVVGEKRSG